MSVGPSRRGTAFRPIFPAKLLVCAATLAIGCRQVPTSENPPVLSAHTVASGPEVRFVDNRTQPFGLFRGVKYLLHAGRFEGTTGLGAFRVPYEIVAPGTPGEGNGTVVVEPPHFTLRLPGRDIVLGHALLFGRGFSHASVAFGTRLLNLLDPTATDSVIAGDPVDAPVPIDQIGTVDEEIIVQFAHALSAHPFARGILGPVQRRYAYGVSQTSGALRETLLSPGGPGLFDLTLLHVAMLRPPFAVGEFDRADGEFTPFEGAGRVMFVESEADQLLSDAEEYRRAAGHPDHRVYEVAGAAHQPSPSNPLDHLAVVRAIFVAGDNWIRVGTAPPPSTLLQEAPPGDTDPVYGIVTGIARDGDGNALGGVRLPDLAIGRAQFIATTLLPGFAGLIGLTVDLSCERFSSHGDYVHRFALAANALRDAGFLLQKDALAMKHAAAESDVATPEACGD